MNIQTIQDAALDGEDWPTAAFCLLADPLSQTFPQPITRGLAQIAFDVPLGETINRPDVFVGIVIRMVEDLEARHV